MNRILVQMIKGYQITIGMFLPRVCRFEPTCSSYAIEAFREHGTLKGTVLSIWRILRCNPFFSGGWDPVPKRSCNNE
ncbi:membrane protein insertion efficiency factor YidD [candidate division WOR-3 bacterium]|nr:membrane protein insertion efficiency factor YidD [candidate division WOR-3 bacterium]